MQRFLRVFTVLSLVAFSCQLFAQSDLEVFIFEDVNGDGIEEGVGITGLLTELVLYEDTNGNGVGEAGEVSPIIPTDDGGGQYTFSGIVVGVNDFIVGLTDQSPSYYVTVAPVVGAPLDNDGDNDLDLSTWQTAAFTLADGVTEVNVDLGLVVPATIGDLVWEDFNGNGTLDGADTGFDWVGAGININLTAASGNTNDLMGNPFTAVDLGGGGYEFQNLPPDDYTLEFTQIANSWYRTQVGPDSAPDQGTGFTGTVTLESGMTDVDQDAGYVQPVTIGDLVWEDFNGNGAIDGPDVGFDWVGAGININLVALSGITSNLDGVPFTAIDLGAGGYEFQNLAPDTYRIEFEQIADNWYRTIDGGDSAPDQITGFTADFVLESGMMDFDQDAGYIQPAKISDFVWEDINGNGIQDGGEPGIDFAAEGITINITLLGGAAATDLDGNSPPLLTDLGGGIYEFNNLAPGDYELVFGEIAMMWYISQQNTTGVTMDSDPDALTGLADNGGAGYTLMSGDMNEDVDAGYVQPAKISDFVWEDQNGDGLQDAGEPGVAGVDVMITDDLGGGVTDLDGNPVIMATSDGGGMYEFLLLPPGDYILNVNTNVLTDYYLSLQDAAGTPGDAGDVDNDSDANQITGETHTVEIESNEQQEDIDFAYFRSGTIEAVVFHDSDGNGQNGTNSDKPFAGMTVQLATSAGITPVPDVFGVLIPDQVSDGAGMVTFNDVPPGDYMLIYQLPGGWEFTYQDQSGFTTDADDVNDDSDAVMGAGSPGMSHIITLEGGEVDNTSSVGIYKLMSIGNLVWIDSNGGDGTFDVADDNGAANVIVNLLYDSDFDGTPETAVFATTTTDAAGEYQFDNLIPGFYQVFVSKLNFDPGAALVLFQNCSGGGNTTVDNDNDGNGDALAGDDIVSQIVELFCDDTSNLPGPDENLHIDFCFFFDCSGPNAIDLSYPICQEAADNDPICDLVLLDSYCGSMNTNTSIGDQPNPLCPDGNGTPHNSSWFAFVAGEAGFEIQVVPYNCTNAGTFSGIQAGVYTDCSFTDAVYCEAGCSTNAITVGGSGTALVPGQTYYFFLDGCGGSVCDFEVNVIQGTSIFQIPEPTGLSCNVTDCGPICPDGEITFTVEGLDLEIDYSWVIPAGSVLVGDGEQTGSTVVTMTNQITLAFPDTGSFTVTMQQASNGCDQTASVDINVDVIQPDPVDFGEYTVCEHDLTAPSDGFGNGETDNLGNALVGPTGEAWNSGNLTGPGIDMSFIYVDPNGCSITEIIDIIQIDDAPREDVNLAICSEDLPYEYDLLVITGNGGGGFNNFNYTLVDTPAASGCDSTITLTTVVLEHELGLETNCTESGVEISFSFESTVPNIPDEVTYQWYKDDNMNSSLDGGEDVSDSDGVDRVLQVDEIGVYCVDVTLSHFVGESGEASCVFTYCQDVLATVPEVSFDLIEEECQDSTVSITFTGSVGASAIFDWDFGNGTTSAVEGPHDVTYTAPGKYYVSLSVEDNGCISDEIVDSIMIIERLPAPMFMCESTPTSIIITWDEIPGATDYEVTLLGGSIGTQTTPTTWEVTGVSVSDSTKISVAAVSDGACALGNAATFSCFAQDCDEPIFTFTPTRDTICLTTDVGLDTIYLDIVGGTTPNTNVFTGPGIINGQEGVFDASVAGVGMHTISYTYSGDDNCMFSRSVIMHVFEQPISQFTTDTDTICISNAFTVEYTGGTTGADYIWDFGADVDVIGTGVGPFQIAYSTTGMKTITLTVEKEECTSDIISKNVWVEAQLPELVIECITDATSINYFWNDIADEYEVIIDAVSQGVQTETTWDISPLSPGTSVSIEVIAISPNKCLDSADNEECSATNCPGVSVAIDPIVQLICLDATTDPIDLEYTVTGGFADGSGIAVWSGNGVDAVNELFDPIAAGEGAHTITLNYSEGECDAEEVSIVVTVVNNPTADFDGIMTVCEGTSITLTHTGVGGMGAIYTWTTTGATVDGANDQSSITLSYDNSGDYDVSLLVTRDGCISELVTQSIQIDEGLLDPVIFCTSTSTSITFGWGAVDGATEYEVLIDGISMGTQMGTSYPITGLSPNDVREIMVIAISDNECMNSSFMDDCVAINCPDTQIIPDEVPPLFCEGDLIMYDIDYTIMGGFMDGSEIMTFNGPSTDPTTGIVDISALNPGEYTVYLDLSEGPCDTRDSVLITVVELPTPTLDFLPVICETEILTVIYTGEDIPGAVVNIMATGNPTETTLPNGSTFEWDDDGTYELIVEVTVGDCVIASDPYSLSVEPELSAPVVSCNQTTTTLDLSWDAVDCASMYIVTVNGVAEPMQSETTFTITGLEPETSVDYTVEAISDCACINSTITDMCSTLPCEGLTIEVTQNIPGCISNLPASVQLEVELTGSVGGGSGSWSGEFVSMDGVFNYALSGVGIHEVTYTYEENGCDYSELDTVLVYDPPVITFNTLDLSCFDSNDGSIMYEVNGGDGSYDITIDAPFPDFPKSFTGSGTLDELAPGDYTIVVLDGNQCRDEVDVTIFQQSEPSFDVLGPPSIAVGTFGDLSLDLGTISVDQITNLRWYNETETLCDGPDCFSLSVSPSTNSLYCVDITLEGGCVITSCLPVISEFISILNVSNIFSPNGDGSNDNMVIHTNNPDMVASYIRIFDRWGNMVFNLDTPWQPFNDMNYPGWDGTYKGQKLNPGVYVYVFEFIEEPGGTPEVRVGDITLIK